MLPERGRVNSRLPAVDDLFDRSSPLFVCGPEVVIRVRIPHHEVVHRFS